MCSAPRHACQNPLPQLRPLLLPAALLRFHENGYAAERPVVAPGNLQPEERLGKSGEASETSVSCSRSRRLEIPTRRIGHFVRDISPVRTFSFASGSASAGLP